MRVALAVLLCAAAMPAAARDRVASCLIEVDGETFLKGPCNFSPDKDGSFSIGTGESERTRSRYFAYVNKNQDGTAEAMWNEVPTASHAQTSLGTVKQHGACWTNAHARICAK